MTIDASVPGRKCSSARLPFEVQIFHYQTLSGEGYMPKRFSTQVQMRYYTRLFGAPLRLRPAASPVR